MLTQKTRLGSQLTTGSTHTKSGTCSNGRPPNVFGGNLQVMSNLQVRVHGTYNSVELLNTDSTSNYHHFFPVFNETNMSHPNNFGVIAAIVLLFAANTFAVPVDSSPVAQSRVGSPSCAPGGNFNLKSFTLQLPTGSSGKVDQVPSSKLSGCNGWSSPKYFYTSPSGALVMEVPSRAVCVTTPNSKHCRTELRESSPSSWDPKQTVNSLAVKLSVPKPDGSQYGTVIGQVKVDDSVSKKPVAELFYSKAGILTIGVSQIPDVSSLKMTEVGHVEVGKEFEYVLRYEGGKLSVQIDGAEKRTLSTRKLQDPESYFKVGNYNQGDDASEVVFYSIEIKHG